MQSSFPAKSVTSDSRTSFQPPAAATAPGAPVFSDGAGGFSSDRTADTARLDRADRVSRTLDPRTKLFLLLAANLMLFFHVALATQIIMAILFLIPLAVAGRWRLTVNFAVLYAVFTALGLLDPEALGLPWLHVVSALAVGTTMMLPCFMTGAYAFTTTSASAFICSMRRMRVPEAVVIPCVVVIRFFPTIAEDYRQIRNAMALRGIASGGWGLVRHPAQSLEYILIPLLMNATTVAQDLSVAALTKGLGREGEHTSRTPIRMRAVDWLAMVAVMIPLGLDIAGVIR
ncbi:energy-coupling factor transporter transmembrane protein EcfT [Bifidobacterium callitrichidarum]|uniref:Energy-coupling factor transporter transmembrane protein EcfT n=1 Tax=Bifidobacterium callitrichidarum TaxID=2052941 RepID=A0A2U2NCW5_9BIFI|nr:energy-coupling factor transporter transmembrane protein EcfT [Bifidobacterium callitrichidarum]